MAALGAPAKMQPPACAGFAFNAAGPAGRDRDIDALYRVHMASPRIRVPVAHALFYVEVQAGPMEGWFVRAARRRVAEAPGSARGLAERLLRGLPVVTVLPPAVRIDFKTGTVPVCCLRSCLVGGVKEQR